MKVVLASVILLVLVAKVSCDKVCLPKCKSNERCVSRKFSCETPSCPQMRYCAKNRKESLEGPTSCDSVKCSNGFICTVRLRQCNWESCREKVARCITEMEFHDGPASCTGYKCPLGEDCILRESICSNPPCKLFKACFNKREIKTWLEKCKSIGCLSPHECFLRKPEKLCGFSKCSHSPDCLAQTESGLESYEQCRGWICPRGQKCHLQGSFKTCGASFKNDSQELSPEKPKSSLLFALLENLNNKSDVINFWVEQSRLDKNFSEFKQWLQTVRFLLGDDAFSIWLSQIRNSTEEHFHRWLPTEDSKGGFWNSSNQTQGLSYKTENLINPEFHMRSFLNTTVDSGNSSALKNPDKNLTLFYPKEESFRRKLDDKVSNSDIKTASNDYYLSVMKLIEKLLEAIAPVIEYNQQSVIQQLVNESAVMDDRKKISVITVLQRLRDERQSYVNIINKTRELIGKAQPAVPSVLIDELIDKLAENISSRRQFSGSDNSTVEIIAVPADYPDNETEFFLVDYGEPISDIKVNQSVPRIVVRIENNLEPKPRIGTVKVDYGSGNSSGFLKLKDDYYTEDGVYDTANRGRNKTNSV